MSVSELPEVDWWVQKPGKLLEIGGKIDSIKYDAWYMTRHFARLGHTYYGIDKVDDRKDLNVKRCDVEGERLPFKSGMFDYVILMQVLEHLGRDPVFALKEMNRVCKFKGLVIVTTPNFFNFTNMWSLLRRRKHHDFDSIINERKSKRGYTAHIRIYTMKEVKELLEYAGFEVIFSKFMLRRDTMIVVGRRNNYIDMTDEDI